MAPVHDLLLTKADPSSHLSFKRHVKYYEYELRAPPVTTPNQMAPLKGGTDRCTPRFLITLTQQIIIGTHWYPFTLCPIGLHRTALQDIAPFFLLHRREMEIPNKDNLKAQITSEKPSQKRSLETLKASLNLAYKLVAKANQKSHQNNKRL